MPSTRALIGLWVLLAGWIAGCECRPPRMATDLHRQGTYPPGVLPHPRTLGNDFMWRQTVTARFMDREGESHSARFEAIVQKSGDVLSVLGMTPFGSRAFLVEQVGVDVRLQRFVNRDLPFPPRFILLDVHRTYLQQTPEAPTGEEEGAAARRKDGWRSVVRDGEELRERFERGVLVERRYRRLDGRPAGEIVIHYTGAHGPANFDRVELRNGWFDYTLEIETLERQRL